MSDKILCKLLTSNCFEIYTISQKNQSDKAFGIILNIFLLSSSSLISLHSGHFPGNCFDYLHFHKFLKGAYLLPLETKLKRMISDSNKMIPRAYVLNKIFGPRLFNTYVCSLTRLNLSVSCGS